MTEHDEPQPHAPRPVPDLGFFAGAPQPRDGGGAFGGAAPASSGQFGTFGAAAAAPPSQFGGASVAGGQFGQFGGAPASPFGAPAVPVPLGPPPGVRSGPAGPLATLRATPGGRWALRVGAGLAVAAVLGMLGIGRFAFLDLFGKEVSAPSSLGGLPPADQQAALDQLEQQLSGYGSTFGIDFEVAAYGDSSTPVIFVGATYDDETPTPEEMAAALGTSGGANTRPVGASTCTELERGLVAMCARLDDGLMVAVVAANRSVEDTATLTDEAWDAQ